MNGSKERQQSIQYKEMLERSYAQWAMMRGLAFGERSWVLICAALFLLDDKREFLTVAGVIGLLLGLFFVGPIYGMMIYYTGQLLYRRRRPTTEQGFRRITWQASFLCLPLMAVLSYGVFNLYYESYEGLRASVLKLIR